MTVLGVRIGGNVVVVMGLYCCRAELELWLGGMRVTHS